MVEDESSDIGIGALNDTLGDRPSTSSAKACNIFFCNGESVLA